MQRIFITTTLVAGALALATPLAQAQDAAGTATATVKVAGNAIAKLIEQRGAAIVNVRALLSVGAGGQSNEQHFPASGVIVDPSGLILTTNLQSTDLLNINRRMKRQMAARGMTINVKLASAKVVVEGVEEELDAFLVATDTELGISFLQIADLGDIKLHALDLTTSAKPVLGETVYAVTKMAKAFDYATVVREGRIGGKLKKPRTSYAITGGINAVGLPLFNAAGLPLGIFTTLSAEAGEGGEASANLLLPARPVRTAVGRALPKAKELLVERAAKKDGEGEEEADKPAEKPAEGGSGF